MKKKKTWVNSKNQVLPQEKNKKELQMPGTKNIDFGDIPDIDPKKFLGCS